MKKLLIISFFALVFLLIRYSLVWAQEVTAPTFPSCENVIFASQGDRAHFDFGTHGIPGVGNLEGSDDVFVIESGNFLQCFCPVTGTTGIQSNWWNVGADGLTTEQINTFKSQGWMFEQSGAGWNLPDDPFLIMNRNFSCVQQVSTPTPSVTPNPTATPTEGPSVPQSKCFDLEAEPKEGTAPLTVKFTGHADDPSQQGKMKAWRFDFADTSGNQPQVVEQTDKVAYHRYEISGEYEAKLDVQDQAGNWRGGDDCKVKIKVNPKPQILGASTPSELPSTGLPSVILGSLLPLAGMGYFLYRRFRLV
jgi:FOG: PKD repeat